VLLFLLSAANVATSGSVTVSPVQSATVLLITRPPHAAAAGLLLSARRAGDIHRLLPGPQQQRRRITVLSSKCGQCHVDSLRRKLNTDLFAVITIVP